MQKPDKSFMPSQVESWPFVEEGQSITVPAEFERLMADPTPLFGVDIETGTLVMHPDDPERASRIPISNAEEIAPFFCPSE